MFKMLSMHWGSTAKLQYVYASTLSLYSHIRSDNVNMKIIEYIFYSWGGRAYIEKQFNEWKMEEIREI